MRFPFHFRFKNRFKTVSIPFHFRFKTVSKPFHFRFITVSISFHFRFKNGIKVDVARKLVLCGDYIHGGYDSYGVVEKIIELKKKYKSRVVVLMGNHENWVIEQGMPIVDEDRDEGEYDDKRENKCINFIQQMELYYKYKNEVLFCHAGVDEEAEDYWEQGTSDYWYLEKFPPSTGPFCINIVAGHISTASPYLANDSKFQGIYYDGQSHYYIDGDVLKNGIVPVIMYDTEKKKFYEVHDYGNEEIKARVNIL